MDSLCDVIQDRVVRHSIIRHSGMSKMVVLWFGNGDNARTRASALTISFKLEVGDLSSEL
jgi:hypothetical protein